MDLEFIRLIKVVLLIFAIVFAAFAIVSKQRSLYQKKLFLIYWLIVPPIFFYFEYFFQAPLLNKEELIRFKDLQHLASQIWVAIAAVLAIIYFKSDNN